MSFVLNVDNFQHVGHLPRLILYVAWFRFDDMAWIKITKVHKCIYCDLFFRLWTIGNISGFNHLWIPEDLHQPSPLRWRHNGRDGVSNHQPHDCLLKRLFRCRSKKTSKLRVTGLCAGNSQGTDGFPAQKASNAENVSIWRRQHDTLMHSCLLYLLYHDVLVQCLHRGNFMSYSLISIIQQRQF